MLCCWHAFSVHDGGQLPCFKGLVELLFHTIYTNLSVLVWYKSKLQKILHYPVRFSTWSNFIISTDSLLSKSLAKDLPAIYTFYTCVQKSIQNDTRTLGFE